MRSMLIVIALILVIAATAPAQDLHKPWEFSPPTSSFPKFFSSDVKYDILLNDFLARQWFASPGPGAYTGPQQTFWREWNALATIWIDTSRNPSIGRDNNSDLKNFLLSIQMDQDGYVFTYPPSSGYRNKLGWPLPDYTESGGATRGWDWDDTRVGQDGWAITGGGTISVGDGGAWNMLLIEPDAYIQVDKLSIDAFQSPYLIVAIGGSNRGLVAIQWTTDKEPEWSDDNSVEITVASRTPVDSYLPLYQYAGWKGNITGLRIKPLFQIPDDGIELAIDRVHCAYDTRHPDNNTSFILASWRYYLWTGDDDFLKANMARIRAAAHYLRFQLKGDREGMVVIPYCGHDGTSGTSPKARPGYGIGSDYLEMLPTGYKSAYTNTYYVAALKAMADLEDAAARLSIKANPYGENAASFKKQANAVAKVAGEFFWDSSKGRFIGCEDVDGKRHDYGFVYLNLEALYYGLGDAKKAESIFSWLDGSRVIEGDTSVGKDIYSRRFAPRMTTKRNTDWYCWLQKDPQKIPWGAQLPDGGTSAYVSFYDIMDRIKYKSPDDAYTRLREILDWHSNVWDVGGYMQYYNGKLAGLGIDGDFVQTTLVPMTFLYGFMGIDATAEGLVIEPRLPKALSKAGVQNLTYHGAELTIAVAPGKIAVKCTRNPKNKSFLLSGRRVSGTFEKTIDGGYAILAPGD